MIIEYGIALLSGLLIDGLWLGVISKSLYQKMIGELMLKKPIIFPALLFYILFAAGLVVFISDPAIKNNWGLGTIIWHGALLGLLLYGAYDLTNLAILKGWSINISIIDMAWGTSFSIIVSLVTVYISRLLIK